MSKASVKAVIDAAIRQNGNQEITATVLNSVLNQMVDEVPDVVNDVTTGGTGKALSAEMGKDLGTEVSQLAQKIDEFAQGKFYGYFGDASELPAGDIPGFAYVGTEPPFAIYNYDGETWTDSGLTVNDIPVGNNEDIDFNAGGLLQFANRAYDAQDPNGMGYVILRKNKTFASQVTEANTIYEIRYSFYLNNDTVSLPDNCVLKFNGGTLSNGTINADFLKIDSVGQKIFDNITFSGACRYNNVAKAEWFISDYPTTVTDNTIDNTVELTQALTCGMLTVVIPSKNIRITQTINLTKAVNLIEDKETAQPIIPPKQLVSSSAYSNTRPAIFSDQVTTLLSYSIGKFDASSDGEEQLTIGKLTFVTTKAYTDLSGRDTPIINIATNGVSLWGVTLHCDIYVPLRMITIDGDELQYGNWTGIKLISTSGYITVVSVDGNIYNTFLALQCVKGGSFFTAVSFYANTASCRGISAENIQTVIVGGFHQAQRIPSALRNAGYITGKNIYLFGYVFDTGGSRTVEQAVHDDGFLGNDFAVKLDSANPVLSSAKYRNKSIPVQHDYIKDFADRPNLLNFILRGAGASRGMFDSFTYTIDGIPTLSSPKIFNSHHLFNEHYLGLSDVLPTRQGTSCFFYDGNGGEHILHLEIIFNKDYSYCYNYQGGEYKTNACSLYYNMPRNGYETYTLKVSYYDGNSYVEYFNKSIIASFYGIGEILDLSRFPDNKVKIELDVTFTGTFFRLPVLYIPFYGPMSDNVAFVSTERPRFFTGTMHPGVMIFDKTLNKPIWWKGDGWVDATGATV